MAVDPVDDTPRGYLLTRERGVRHRGPDPLHSAWMDPRDQQRALPDGLNCTVCDESVPSERMGSYRGDTRGLVERLHGSGGSSRGAWSVDRGRRP